MKARKASETLSITTKVVLPNDTNPLGNLFGGELLAWMDMIASVSAHRHSKRVVVTASVNNVSFQQPIRQSSIVTLEAKVSRAFNSSMEVFVDVFLEDPLKGTRLKCNEAIYTFVAVEQNGRPIQVRKEGVHFDLAHRNRIEWEIDKLDEFKWAYTIRRIELTLPSQLGSLAEDLGASGYFGDQQSEDVQNNTLDLGDLGISPEMVTEYLSGYIREVRVRIWWGEDPEGDEQVEILTHVINPSGVVTETGDQEGQQ